MAMNQSNNSQVLEYSADDVYQALNSALKKDSHYTIVNASETTRSLAVKTRASGFSWGENINISVSPQLNGFTEVSVSSTSKVFSNVLDGGKSSQNFVEIMRILANEIARRGYSKVSVESSADASSSIPAQIKELAELMEQGILTEVEFLTKKEELLSRM